MRVGRLRREKDSGVVGEVMSLLNQLSPNELTRVQMAIKAMQSLNGVSSLQTVPETEQHAEILQAVLEAAKSLGIGGFYTQLAVEAKKPNIAEKLAAVENFLKLFGPDKQSRLVALSLGLKMVYADLQWMETPVTVVTLLRNLHRIPALFDRHYPGYARFGLLGMLIKKEAGK